MVKIIQIYDKNTTKEGFNRNGRALNDVLSCFITEELNGIYELELEYPLDSRGKWQELTEGSVIKAYSQLFRIYSKQKTIDKIKVNARHIFYDLHDNFLEDVRPTNLSGISALDWVLTHTQYQHPFTCTGDVGGSNTKYFIRKNPIEAIMGDDGIIQNWGGELERDNFNIKYKQTRGLDRGVHIRYGKNIMGIEENLNLDSVCTRMMPQGYEGLLLPEKYIDSEYINNYPNPKIRKYEFSDIKIDEENGITEAIAIERLRTVAREFIEKNKIDIPQVNYKIDFLELSKTEEYKNYSVLERIYLGDTVTIKHSKLNIDLKCKAVKIKKRVFANGKVKIEEIELGNFKNNIADALSTISNNVNLIKDIQSQDKSAMQKAIDNATTLLTTALGGYVLKRNGEILIMDTEDPLTAIKVWRWNINGLGYSSTGINGPYGLAITMDGAIVASFITTGRLRGGAVDFNLDTGVLEITHTAEDIKTVLSGDGFRIIRISNDEEIGAFTGDSVGYTELRAKKVYAENIITILPSNVTYYVNPQHASSTDNGNGTSSEPFKTVTEALRRVDKFIPYGTVANIYVYGTLNEPGGQIKIDGFCGGGNLNIFFDKNGNGGGISASGCSARVILDGGRTAYNSGRGFYLNKANATAYNCAGVDINGFTISGNGNPSNWGAGIYYTNSQGGTKFCDVSNIYIGVCVVDNSNVLYYDTIGSNTGVSVYAGRNGRIGFDTNGGNVAIPQYTENGLLAQGGGIISNKGTATTYASQTNAPSTQTYTSTWWSTTTKSWRPSSWRTDNSYVYQGEWSGYGQHRGFAYFDNAAIRSALSGSTINGVSLYFSRRNEGGISGAVPFHAYTHNYNNYTEGYGLGTDLGYIGSYARGQAFWVGVSTTLGAMLRDGNARGIALYDGSSNYAINDGSVGLQITYTK